MDTIITGIRAAYHRWCDHQAAIDHFAARRDALVAHLLTCDWRHQPDMIDLTGTLREMAKELRDYAEPDAEAIHTGMLELFDAVIRFDPRKGRIEAHRARLSGLLDELFASPIGAAANAAKNTEDAFSEQPVYHR